MIFSTSSVWNAIGHQLQRPEGSGGWVIGQIMAEINRTPNRLAISALDISSADTVLELGFGPGWAIAEMAKCATLGMVYGVDPSSTMLAMASRRNRDAIAGGRVRLIQGFAKDLELHSGSVDKIIGVNLVYFIGDESGDLRDARRLLKRGGKLSLYATDKSTMKRWRFARSETHRLFGCDDLRSLLVQAGFKADSVQISKAEIGFGITGLVALATRG